MNRGAALIASDEVQGIDKALDELRQAKGQDNHRVIREKIEDLEKVTHHLAEVLMDATLKEALENKKLSEVAD